MSTPHDLAERYFAAWQAGDSAELERLLAADVTFVGPLASIEGREGCIAGLLGMREVLDRLEVQARHGDEHEVITWFDLHNTVTTPLPTANWMRVRDGRISAIRVAFDPRPLLEAGD